MCSSSSPSAAHYHQHFFRDYNKPFVMLPRFFFSFAAILAPIREIVCYFQFEYFSSSRPSCGLLALGLSAWQGSSQPTNQPGCKNIRKDTRQWASTILNTLCKACNYMVTIMFLKQDKLISIGRVTVTKH